MQERRARYIWWDRNLVDPAKMIHKIESFMLIYNNLINAEMDQLRTRPLKRKKEWMISI